MTFKNEATIDILVAFFVLLTAMSDPRLSVTLAIIFLVGLAIYKSIHRPKKML